ncbi:MAG: hypothetical protein ABSA17_03435 [Rhabdochlamydiaceae bacterium]|jgi:hypothetical protein
MQTLIYIPFILQMVVIFLDEALFHIKRDLPKWERIGHPLDTLTVIACFAFVYWVPYDRSMIGWYIALAIFSTIFVTKDEFVHKEHCPAAEQWLHAVLFVNHSIVLSLLGLIWPHLHGSEIFSFLPSIDRLNILTLSQMVGAGCFCMYQIVYWNFIRKPLEANK